MNPWLILTLAVIASFVILFVASCVVIAWVLRADSAEHERRTKDLP